MSRSERILEAALAYAELGWPVLPLYGIDENTGQCMCRGRVKNCKAGKHPHGLLAPHGSKDATTDANKIRSWFANGEVVNIGVVTGQASGVIVLDVDPQHGGNESLKRFGKLPQTPTVLTGGSGAHYWFKHPGGDVRNSAGTIAEGLDVRGHNGYVCVPPSLHASGQEYRWVIDARAPLAECPAWLLNGQKKKTKSVITDTTEKIPEGKLNNEMTMLAGKLRHHGLRSKSIFAALLYENDFRCNLPLPESELKSIADSISKYEPSSVPSFFEAVTVNLAEVEPKPIRWLWPDRIPMGGFSLLVGNGGEGKSTLTVDIAARTTTGTTWPDNYEVHEPGSAVLLTAEDSLSDVIVPRLMAAGADLKRVVAIKAVRETDSESDTSFDIRRHVSILQDVISKQDNTRLVIIDPVSSFLGKIDSHKNAETRSVLSRLAALAEKTGVAIICITHLNKNVNQQASTRIIGSVAFNAAARAVWHVVQHPDDSDLKLLLPGKNNLAEPPDGLAFRLVGTQDGDIKSVRVEYEKEAVCMDIDEVLSFKKDSTTKVDEATKWLKEKLAEGERLSTTLIEEAKNIGFSRDVLFKAKTKAGINASKVGFGKDGQWFWRLPDAGDQ